VNPYLALLSLRFRERLQYRAAALAGAGTQVFWGLIKIMILQAFFTLGGGARPLDFGQVVVYVWLGQAFLGMLPWNHDRELEAMIRGGEVAYELVRPADLYGLWYARTVALRAASVSLRCAPVLVLAGAMLPWSPLRAWALPAPVSLEAGVYFALAMLAALALGCAITTLVHVSLLWTISGAGVANLVPSLVTLGSGMVLPLPLFPEWAQPLIRAQPFRGLCDTPYRIYAGDLAGAAALWAILHTLLWTAALVALGRLLLALGTRRVVVQGG
jgi:ABC-2 type transport system permease protein